MFRFNDMGFPTRNDEEWRFTNPSLIAETPFRIADANSDAEWLAENNNLCRDLVAQYVMSESDHIGIAFVNGRSVPVGTGLSLVQDGLCVLPFSHLFHGTTHPEYETHVSQHLNKHSSFETHAFAALNTAFFEDGAFIYIPANTVVERPIEIVYISTSGEDAVMSTPRTLIIAEKHSQATIIETYIGIPGGGRLTNAVTEVVLADGAVVDHYKRCEEPAESGAFHVGVMSVQLGRSSNFSSHAMTFGGGLVRNEVYAELTGEYAECTLNGLYLGGGSHLIDNHTTIDHAAPNCNSHEIYKGILDGHSRGVFNGKIYVRVDAQKTDAKQTNKTLLLSPDARIDTKPQLEILADDVKCTHGATVGQLDPNQIFYLRSRGMSETGARSLLTYAFAGDIVQRIKVEALRNALDKKLLELLPSR
jgi:Fe-S cluster assembly protein SufD